jgi:uncharacterized protein (TIRG00374 family)
METKTRAPLSLLKATRYLLPLLLLGLAVHLLLPQLSTLEHSMQVIRQMAFWAVGLAILAQITSYLGSGYLLKTLVNLSGSKLSILRGTLITLAGASLGMVAGGMVGSAAAIYRWMQNENVRPEGGTLAGTIPGLFYCTVLVSVSLAGLIHLLVAHELSRIQGISFVLILAILSGLIGLLVWDFRHRNRMGQFAEGVGQGWARFRHKEFVPGKIEVWLTSLYNAADTLITGGWRGPLLGATLNVAFDMLTLYFLFIAAGNRVSFGVLVTGYGLPLLLGKMAFMVPGGVGIIESTMAGLYTGLGVPNSVTVVVVLAYRIISFWLPLLLGFPIILFLQGKTKNSPEGDDHNK